MSAINPDKPPSRRRRLRRWVALCTGLCGLAVLVLLALYLGRERWLTPLVRTRAAKIVLETTGLELRFARLGGNWYDHIELEELALEGGRPTTALAAASCAQLSVKFDLWRLIQGDLTAIRSIEARSARVALDLEPRTAQRPASAAAGSTFPWPDNLPALDLRDVDVSLRMSAQRSLSFVGLQLASRAPTRAELSSLDLRVERAAFSDAQLGSREARLQAVLDYHGGRLGSASVAFDERVLARELQLDLGELQRGRLSFAGIADLFGGSTELRGELGQGQLGLWVDSEGVELSEVLRELGSGAQVAGTVHVQGLFELPLSNPANWVANVCGNVAALQVAGRGFDLGIFQGRVAGDRIELRELELWSGVNRMLCHNFACSLAEPRLDDLLRTLTGTAELEILDPRPLLLDAPERIQSAAARVQRAHFQLGFSALGMAISAGDIDTDAGGLSIQRGRALWGARGKPWYEGLELELDLALSFDDLAPLAAMFGRGDVSGALAGTVELRGPALAPSGRFLLAGNGLEFAGLRLGRLTCEARADRQRLFVQRLELDGELGQAAARGEFDYGTGAFANTRVTLRSAALETLSAGRARASLALLDATIEGEWRVPTLWANLRAWDLEVAGRTIAALDVEGLWRDREALVYRCQAEVDAVEVDLAASLRHSEDWKRWQVGLERALLRRGELDLELEAPLEFESSAEHVALRGLCARGSAGRATADFDWTPAAQSLALEAYELQPMRLLRPFLPDDVTFQGVRGSLQYRHSLADSYADAALRIDDLRLFSGSPQAALDFAAHWDGRTLAIERLELLAGTQFGLSVRGMLPTDPPARDWLAEGPLALDGRLHLADLGSLPWERLGASREWSGRIDTRFDLGGTSSKLSGSLDASLDIRAVPPESRLHRAHLDALRFDGRVSLGEGLRLDRARLSVPARFSAVVDGGVALALDPRAWLRGERLNWRELALDLRARLAAEDLSFVAGLTPALRRTAGQLQGDLQLGGTLGMPHPSGTLELLGGELRLANALAGFEKLSARIAVEGRSVRIVALEGEYGAAPFSAGGTLDFASGEPVFDLLLQGKGLLLAREEGLRLRADADLALRGPLRALALSGDLVLVEGRYSKDFALLPLPSSNQGPRPREFALPFLRQAPWADLELDVRVRAQKPVRIETNIVRGTIEPKLQLRGSGSAPRLGGSILIGAMSVRLPASSLQVNTGVVTFSDETSLVPELNVSATTRLRGHDVTAQLSGTSSEPEIFFTSSPPLASEEIAVLVLTGQLPESALSGSGGNAAAQTMVTYLGEDLLTRWLGQAEGGSEDPFSERLEFAQGVEVSDSGVESTEVVFRLTPRPRGKSRIVYLRAERDIYERINFGVKLTFRFR